MRKIYSFALKSILVAFLVGVLCAATTSNGNSVKVGVVNFKECVEKSKVGKHEQEVFEALKKQMENSLIEKEKTLNEISAKLNDPDYIDTLSSEAEAELKHKFRAANQEISQYQNQYYQALNQTNVKIVQQLHDVIEKTVTNIAKEMGLDLVLGEEGLFYYNPTIDITSKVVEQLDKMDKAALESTK